jgi:hypothetical protein
MNQLLSNTIAIVFFKSLLIDDFNKDLIAGMFELTKALNDE